MINALRLASTDTAADAELHAESEQLVPGRTALLDELKRLRKGRGIFAVDIDRRVGPMLRMVAGIEADDGPAEVRNKVARRLQALADSLPGDLRAAALAAFAVASDARQPLYKDRVALTASRIGRDARTARRRIDEAIEQLTQVATARIDNDVEFIASATTDWYFTEFIVSLILDRDHPELIEQARVVAESERLAELPLHADRMISRVADRAVRQRDVLYGGNLDNRGAADDQRPLLALARPLKHGQTHEYAVREQLMSRRALRSHVRYVPTVRCDRFVLRIRFPVDEPPTRVVGLGRYDDDLVVDGFGELLIEARDLVAGHHYGVAWEWQESAMPRSRTSTMGSPGLQLCGTASSSPRQIPAITPTTRHAADTFTKDNTEQTILITALPSSCAGSTGGRRFNAG